MAALRRGAPCHLQCAVDRFDHCRIQYNVRMLLANLIVEKFANHRGMTKDSTGHGHRDSRGI